MDRLLDAIGAATVAPTASSQPAPSHPLATPVAPVAAPSATAARLFVCVGKHCRAAGAGRDLVDAVNREGAAAGVEAVTCGCLDHCDTGPAAVAYGGPAAGLAKPPKDGLQPPLATFHRVSPDQASAIVARLTDQT
jgi:(2Fe-2S) ferredoxin